MNNFFDKFKLNSEKEELQTVIESIDNGVVAQEKSKIKNWLKSQIKSPKY